MRFYEKFKAEKKVPRKPLAEDRGLKVFLVNDFELRNMSPETEEFSNYAIHEDLPKWIPEGEVWISARAKKEERWLYVEEAYNRLRFEKAGLSEKQAYEKALALDKAHRTKMKGVYHKPASDSVDKVKVGGKPYMTVNDGKFKVWKVDGEKVRDLFKTDFVEGGHGYVYPWIPKDEIWLEAGLSEGEYKFILHHEWVEMNLMKSKDMPYEKAHQIAAKSEYEAREKTLGKKD